MTAEVAIMNTGAVALAADSAVTIHAASGAKVYNTVNKLFSLSVGAPVGVMIWGGAELCGVPWETLIKEYRRHLDAKRFPALEDYCADLTTFLTGNRFLTASMQEADIHRFALSYYVGRLVDQVLRAMHQHFEQNGSVTRQQVVRIVTSALDDERDALEKAPFAPGFATADVAKFLKAYRDPVDAALKVAFEDLPLGRTNTTKARRILALFCCKQPRSPQRSGLVVAGFGEDDVFPKVVSHEVDGYFLDRVKMLPGDVQVAGPDNRAVVMPFAQREMVSLFMEGVDPEYRAAVQGALDQFSGGLPEAVADAVGATGAHRKKLVRNLRARSKGLLADFERRMDEYSMGAHVMPIIEAVAALPKDELGAMAESLVNLTSFKRRVTLDAETVGGAIDVAVISKGDGLIWLKRKHYFEADRNPQFFARYK